MKIEMEFAVLRLFAPEMDFMSLQAHHCCSDFTIFK